MNALEIRNLTKSYGKNKVLKGINLSVPQNSVYGFLGNNGAGKTTTFSILGGFLKKDNGSFNINGKISILPQDARFYSDRSILSQLTLFAMLSGSKSKEAKQEAFEVLKNVGLIDQAKTRPDKLSHGMLKRLSIAQALLGNPDIILLDEPLSGLDPQNAFEIRKLITDLGKNKTLLISSHILSDISELCDTVGIIHAGKTKFEGSLTKLTKASSIVNFYLSNKLEQTFLKSLEKDFNITYLINENKLSIEFDSKIKTLEEINANFLALLIKNKIGLREIKSGENLENEFLKTVTN